MNGITILSERQIEIFGLNGTVLWITVPFCAAIAIFFTILYGVNEYYEWQAIVLFTFMSAILGAMIGFLIGVALSEVIPKGFETVYDVLIDESVSMTEFYERYEIIDQRGRIFTIKELTK